MNTPAIMTDVPRLPARPTDGHKGSFGRVLVVAGSRGMTGAAILCGSAAISGGAGLVRIATPEDALDVVAAGNPCYTLVPLSVEAVVNAAESADVIALGPGLGATSTPLVRELLPRLAKPLVLDADGLNALAGQPELLKQRPAATIITPHPAEFGRLTGRSAAEVNADRDGSAQAFAQTYGVVVVLKGSATVVTDGQRLYRNTSGNPGMGTGGTGDVLTGLTAALWGQGLEPFTAAQLGVYLHGVAGDLARDALGEIGMSARDLLLQVPEALRRQQG
jgi:NAD(P)H-hydrate epimerase